MSGKFSSFSHGERKALIRENPEYGQVVCRCEKITAAEIRQAIERGADTMDGVKHLTRAGMGRCQGGFCGPTVLNLLSRQTGAAPNAVTKKGPGSGMLAESAEGGCAATDTEQDE